MICAAYSKCIQWITQSCDQALSKVGNLIMIQSVVQSIPTYVMSCLQIPKTVCRKISVYIRQFWLNYNPLQIRTNIQLAGTNEIYSFNINLKGVWDSENSNLSMRNFLLNRRGNCCNSLNLSLPPIFKHCTTLVPPFWTHTWIKMHQSSGEACVGQKNSFR